MHARHWILGFSLLSLGACSNSARDPEPQAGDDSEGDRKAMAPPPPAGGATGDFGGDCSCDALERELALDEPDEVLGFSGQDVLARLEGEYAVPILWQDLCIGAEGKAARGCDVERPAFAGSTTDVRITVAPAGSRARVVECNRGDTGNCHITTMYLPVEGTLTSADGLLDEAFAIETGTESLEHVSVGGRVGAALVQGAVADEVATFAGIEWNLTLSDTLAIFEVFVLSDQDGFERGLLVSHPPEGTAPPDGHSWGVALDLEDARQ